MRIAFCCLLLLVPPVLFADKQPLTLEAAEALERDKKFDQAMAVYEEWLKDHAADFRFPAVLRRCGELKKNPLAAVELYKTNLPRVRDASLKRIIQREIALLYTVLGDNRSALEYFKKTYADPSQAAPNDPWLAAVPTLYIACGETDKAYAWVKRVDTAVTERSLRGELNYALLEIYLIRGDIDSADRAILTLETGFANTVSWPRALLRMCVFYLSRAQREKAAGWRDRLLKDFPSSLEYQAAARLLSGKKTDGPGLLANPNEIMGGAGFEDGDLKKSALLEADEKTAAVERTAPANQPEPRAGAGLRLQVGSYTMRENAEYMVRDLTKLGFKAETVSAVIQGKTFFRVFVGNGLSADEAQIILARLNDSGIGGYLFTGE